MSQNYQGSDARQDSPCFITGINYWPAGKAMYWWRAFEAQEVEEDFKRLAANNFGLVRIFLLWEDFQPRPETISTVSLDYLKTTADLAQACGLGLMPTFFCGHMSGLNWLPSWMLSPGKVESRFPVCSDNRLSWAPIRNCYIDQAVIDAQAWQIQTVAAALRDHKAVFAYDLGNEASNWVTPPEREDARRWLQIMKAQIKQYSGGASVTLGMHAEDLEEDRRLWPQDAARSCDFLCMHGYPFYLDWVDNPADPDLVPFLGIITAWLGRKPVLLQEFGMPTQSVLPPLGEVADESSRSCPLWPETEAALYYQQVLPRLREAGMMGAMAWCAADYAPSLWDRPPLDYNQHERFFGLFRHNGTAKPAVGTFRVCHNNSIDLNPAPIQIKYTWLSDTDPDNFYHDPRNNLTRLYQKYKMWLKAR